MIYFDYAATTPLSPVAQQAMVTALSEQWYNPSAQYPQGEAVLKQMSQWRTTIATALGCSPEEFYVTSGGTESNNWAISQGVKQKRHRGKHCITTAIEHSSVLNPFKEWEKQGYSVTYLKPNKQGVITAEQVVEALREDTIMVSCMLVNNETGVLLPVEEIAKAVKEKNPQILTHCDGVQGFLKVPFSMSANATAWELCDNLHLSHIDLLSVSGHKIYAPKGIGGLFIRKGVKLAPLLVGGGQEQGLRSGTEATHQMAAFAAAVAEGQEHLLERVVTLSQLKQQLTQKLEGFDLIKIHDFQEVATAPHILSFSLVGYPSQVVLRVLADQGIALSAGSACHRGGESHVFATLFLSKKERMGALRVSFSHHTTEDQLDTLVDALKQASETLVPSY